MKGSVYIETSVISYYTGRPSRDIIIAGHQEITREWWEKYKSSFNVTISILVLQEAEGGDPHAAKKRLEAVKNISVLTANNLLAYNLPFF